MSINSYQKTIISSFLLIAFVFPICSATIVLAATANSSQNDQLLAAASPFEDLTEYALAGNEAGIAQSLRACDQQKSQVNRLLSPKARAQLEQLISTMKQAQIQGSNEQIALKAVAAYRVLIESLDARHLIVPLQVSLLDYVGFRMQVLLHLKPIDWSGVQRTADEAKQHWRAIESRVADKNLHTAMTTTIDGMIRAAQIRNMEMAGFAAKIDLDLVDLLEGYFE
jgi:hypothetical protein